MERENLAGDVKGKGTSGSNREAESTDAPERGGLPRTSRALPKFESYGVLETAAVCGAKASESH